MTSLIACAMNAPLIGVSKRWPNTLHAIDMDGLPIAKWPDGTATSVCGKTRLRLLGGREGLPIAWPPRVSSLPDGTTRCRDCYVDSPVKKVRSEFVSAT